MRRIPKRIPNPQVKAEGMIGKFAYDTQLASIDGVALHLWTMSDDKPTQADVLEIAEAAARMRNIRDVVYATFSNGSPDGFWAQENHE